MQLIVKRRYGQSLFLGVIALGIVIGTIVAAHFNKPAYVPRKSTLLLGPPAATLKDLVSGADVIVVGRVSSVVAERPFAGYDANGKLIDPKSLDQQLPGLPTRSIWRTDFEIQPDQVIKGQQLVDKGRIVLRTRGKRTSNEQLQDEYPLLAVGDRFLFFLKLNPDQQTFGAGAWQEMILDGPTIAYFDGKRTPPAFASNTTPAKFIEQVLAAVKQ